MAGAAGWADTRVQSTAADFLTGHLENVQITSTAQGASIGLAPQSHLGAWTAGPALPVPLSSHALAAYGGAVYLLGGRSGPGLAALSDVMVSKLSSQGRLGAWIPATSLPEGRTALGAVAYGGYLFAVAGDTVQTGPDGSPEFDPTPDVLSAKILSDGTLGAWQSLTPLPQGDERDFAGVTVYYGNLYVVGGAGVGAFVGTNTALYAPIEADGSVGAWQSGALLPDNGARVEAPAVAAYGQVFALGGDQPQNGIDMPLDQVVYSEVPLPDGAPGLWRVSAFPLPSPRLRTWSAGFTGGGKLFIIGGKTPDVNGNLQATNSIASAQLVTTGDGTGAWSEISSYPMAISSAAAALLGGNLAVVTGGRDVNENDSANVNVAPLVPDAKTPGQPVFAFAGTYESPVIDLTGVSQIGSISWNATGNVEMSIRVADSKGVWGPWSAPASGSPVTPTNGTGRYVQYLAMFSGDGSSTPALTQVSVGYTPMGNVVYGDVNGDGKVNVLDISLILSIAVGLVKPTPAQLLAGDVAPKPGTQGRPFGDGVINIFDAARILRAALGLEHPFP